MNQPNRNPRKLKASLMVAVVAVSCLSARLIAQAPAKPAAAFVRVAAVQRMDVEVNKTFVGTVVASRKSIIGAAVDGRVSDFLVNEGDAVKAGQPVAQLLTKTIEAEVAGATANWDLRKSELLEMQNGTRKEDLAAASARDEAARAVAEYAIAKRRRVENLARTGQATDDEMEEAISLADQLTKLHLAARATYDLAKAGPRKEQIQQATARAAAAQHEVERLQDMLAKYTIRASFDGFVSAEHTEVGEWVNKGAPIVEIVELKHVDVMAMIPEGDIEHLKLGMQAGVDVNALPDAKFDGVVQLIVPQADVKSRSFPVKVRVENKFGPDGQPVLKAGMFSRLSLRVRAPASALLVPKDAIVLGGQYPTVFAVKKEGERSVVRAVNVTLGDSAKGMISVTPVNTTLTAGELVVTEGNERRRAGEEVTYAGANESMR